MQKTQRKQAIKNMAEKWPSTIITRSEVARFTGGVLTGKYLANLDYQGRGPSGRMRIGRKIVYPINEFVKWLELRSQPLAYHVKGRRGMKKESKESGNDQTRT